MPAGRPADPQRRQETLRRATDYVLENGLAGLSLRPLAAALQTSTRMLLYDFGSKQQLVTAVLAEVHRRHRELLVERARTVSGDLVDLLPAIWTWLTAPEVTPYLRLFFEVSVDAFTHPGAYPDAGRGIVEDWISTLTDPETWSPGAPADPAVATIVVATLRGLLLDRLITGDTTCTDNAVRRLTALLRGE